MIVKLNKEVYPKQAVLSGIAAYKDVKKLKFSESENYFLISYFKKNKNEEIISKELLNYILANIK